MTRMSSYSSAVPDFVFRVYSKFLTCNIIYLFFVVTEVFFVGQNPMDTNNWRPTAPGGEPVMDMGDWRTQLQPDSRQRIVNKM